MTEEQLTLRERQAAVLLAYGFRNEDVAQRLDVSLRTAEGDRARIMRKLGARQRSDLVHWALEHELLT